MLEWQVTASQTMLSRLGAAQLRSCSTATPWVSNNCLGHDVVLPRRRHTHHKEREPEQIKRASLLIAALGAQSAVDQVSQALTATCPIHLRREFQERKVNQVQGLLACDDTTALLH